MTDHSLSETYQAAQSAQDRGWIPIPIWEIKDGVCACHRGEKCPVNNWGKHPVENAWQNTPRLSGPDLWTYWMENGHNLGILTGPASGIFVLDIDPKNGGVDSFRQWITDGKLVGNTYAVRTGSGGVHYYFKYPDFTIGNSAKKIAPGIDIRGDGGQVVAPPSVSGVGEYSVLYDNPVADAPAWLLDMLRPVEEAPVEYEVVRREDLPNYEDLDPETQERVQKYAKKVVEDEANTYVHAPEGSGNQSLFDAACSCIEIAQSPWNTVSLGDVSRILNLARLERIRLNPDRGRGQSESEFRTTLRSARQKVRGQARPFPEERSGVVDLDFDMPEMSLMASLSDGSSEELTPEQMARVEAEVKRRMEEERRFQEELFRQRNIRKVRAFIEEEEATRDVEELATKLYSEFLNPQQVAALPSQRALVEDLLFENSEAWLIAEPGSYKSFIALDIACHVARGMPWQGLKVKKGRVLYIWGEGGGGIERRQAAWAKRYGPIEDLFVLPRAVQVTNAAEWNALVKVVEQYNPSLIIVDTLARISVGVEENSATAMGQVISALSRLREASSACVLTLHHTARGGQKARGSSVMDGAQDTALLLSKIKDESGKLKVLLKPDKQKDASTDIEMTLELEQAVVGIDEDGKNITSLCVLPGDPFDVITEARVGDWELLAENMNIVLDAMRAHSDLESGANKTTLHRWIRERAAQKFGQAITTAAMSTALNELKKREVIEEHGSRYVLVEEENGEDG